MTNFEKDLTSFAFLSCFIYLYLHVLPLLNICQIIFIVLLLIILFHHFILILYIVLILKQPVTRHSENYTKFYFLLRFSV